MAKRATDKNICRSCKLSPPHVTIIHNKGKPIGHCKACRALEERTRRTKSAVYKNFYSEVKDLFSLNYLYLSQFDAKAYPIVYRLDASRQGYVIVRPGKVYVSLYGESYLFRLDLFGVATWLANQNLVLLDTPIPLVDALGAPIDASQVGLDASIEDVTDKLVMFDVKLKEYAIKKVKEEIAEAKRSIDLMQKAKSK